MLTHRNLLAMATGVTAGRSRPRQRRHRLLPAVLLGRRAALERGHRAARGRHRELPRGAGHHARGPARDRAPRDHRAAALLGGDVLGVPGEDRRRRAGQGARRRGWRSASACGWPSGRLRRQRVGPGLRLLAGRRPPADLPRAARSAGALARPLRLHRRRRARRRSCSGSSAPSASTSSRCTARRSPAASRVLHPDDDVRPETVGKPTAGTADQDLRGGRDARSRARACSSATTRIPKPPRRRSTTGGSTPATPAWWRTTATWWSSTGSATSCGWPTARASRPRSSRTS